MRACTTNQKPACWLYPMLIISIVSDFKYQFGRLAYRIKSTGAMRGHEDWWLTGNRDGTSTLRSLSITYDTQIVRDAVLTRRQDGRPVDGYLRLQAADYLIGVLKFTVHDESLEISASGQAFGSVSQSLKVAPGAFSILTQSMMLQGWTVFNYDRQKGDDQLRPFYSFFQPTRDDGSIIAKLVRYRVCLLPDEELNVPAGTFKATPFILDQSAFQGVVAKYWVAGGDKILLRCEIGTLDETYELIAWTREL